MFPFNYWFGLEELGVWSLEFKLGVALEVRMTHFGLALFWPHLHHGCNLSTLVEKINFRSLGNNENFGNINRHIFGTIGVWNNQCGNQYTYWTSFLTLVEKIVLGHWETLGTLGTWIGVSLGQSVYETTNVGTSIPIGLSLLTLVVDKDSLGSLGNFGNFGNINRCNVWGQQSIGMKQTKWASCNNFEQFWKCWWKLVILKTLSNGTNYWNLLVTIFLT